MFTYYIVSPETGDVWGTNELEVAEEYSQDDSCYVIDAHSNECIQIGTVGERFSITEPPK